MNCAIDEAALREDWHRRCPRSLSDGGALPEVFKDEIVTAAEIAADWQFFNDNPARRFRIGERFVVRRRSRDDVFLRVPIEPGHHYPEHRSGRRAPVVARGLARARTSRT